MSLILIQFMQKSSLQHSNKKITQAPTHNDFQFSISPDINNCTQIKISTNKKEVPYISIYTPDIRKQKCRIQAVITLIKSLEKCETLREQYAFTKIHLLKLQDKSNTSKCQFLTQIVSKLAKRKLANAFLNLLANKIYTKTTFFAIKALHRVSTNIKVYNAKHSIYKLKANYYQEVIKELKDQTSLAKQLTSYQEQLAYMKNTAYSEQFLSKSKPLHKQTINLIQNLRQSDFIGAIKSEIKRFQQYRKVIQKRRDQLDNQSVLVLLLNVLKSYQASLADKQSLCNELTQKVQSLENSEQMVLLKETLQEKNSQINEIQNYMNEIGRMENEIKKCVTNDIINLGGIRYVIGSQIKKHEARLKNQQGAMKKIASSRLFLISLILKLSDNQQSSESKKIIEFTPEEGIQSLPSRFFTALKIVLDKTSLQPNTKQQILQYQQKFQSYIHQFSELQHKMSSQSLIEEISVISGELTRQNDNLKAFEKNYNDLLIKNEQNVMTIKQLAADNQKLKAKIKEMQHLEFKIGEITSANAQLTLKLSSGKLSHSGIACKQSQPLIFISNVCECSVKPTRPKTGAHPTILKQAELMKQIITLKISSQSQAMNHQKDIRKLRQEIFDNQTLINQLKAEILHREHINQKEKQTNQDLKKKVLEMSRISGMKSSQYYLTKGKESSISHKKQPLKLDSNNGPKYLQNQTNQLTDSQIHAQLLTKQQSLIKNRPIYKKQHLDNPDSQYSDTPSLDPSTIQRKDIHNLETKIRQLEALLFNITSLYDQLCFHSNHHNAQENPSQTKKLSEQHASRTKSTPPRPPTIQSTTSDSIDDRQLSRKLKELMASSQSLSYSIDYLKQECHQLQQKRQWNGLGQEFTRLVFYCLLQFQSISEDSQEGKRIWKEICHIKSSSLIKELAQNLENYCKTFISKNRKK